MAHTSVRGAKTIFCRCHRNHAVCWRQSLFSNIIIKRRLVHHLKVVIDSAPGLNWSHLTPRPKKCKTKFATWHNWRQGNCGTQLGAMHEQINTFAFPAVLDSNSQSKK